MASDGNLLIEEGVDEGFAFSLLPSFDKGFSAIGGEFYRTALADGEIRGFDLVSVYEGEGETVCECGAEFLHEVEGE
jgi:hypothetical protein